MLAGAGWMPHSAEGWLQSIHPEDRAYWPIARTRRAAARRGPAQGRAGRMALAPPARHAHPQFLGPDPRMDRHAARHPRPETRQRTSRPRDRGVAPSPEEPGDGDRCARKEFAPFRGGRTGRCTRSCSVSSAVCMRWARRAISCSRATASPSKPTRSSKATLAPFMSENAQRIHVGGPKSHAVGGFRRRARPRRARTRHQRAQIRRAVDHRRQACRSPGR